MMIAIEKETKLRVCVDSPIGRRDFAWITLRPRKTKSNTKRDREYISIGLLGPAFEIRSIQDADPENQADWDSHVKSLPPQALVNPHLTYHAPHYYHVRSKNSPYVWEGLVWAGEGGPMPDSRMPWFNATSAPIHELPNTRSVLENSLPPIVVPTKDCSVRLHVDFLSQKAAAECNPKIEKVLHWYDLILGLQVTLEAPQTPSISWF